MHFLGNGDFDGAIAMHQFDATGHQRCFHEAHALKIAIASCRLESSLFELLGHVIGGEFEARRTNVAAFELVAG